VTEHRFILGRVEARLGNKPVNPRLAWRKKARPEQLLPPGKWRICYWQGGRGSGKTASGAGGLTDWVLADQDGEGEYGIIAPTYADAWTKCVEGEAGILRSLGTSMAEIKDHRSATVKHAWRTYGQVILHNGIIIYIDSAAEGGLRIQGRNLKGAWCDEIGLWDKWELAWKESLNFAVRKGRSQIIATGTPKASRKARKLIRSLIRNDPEHGGVVVIKLRTRDNIANLSETFVRAVVGGFKGTRLELQELEGELLDDVANALWTRDLLDSIHCPGVGQPGGPEYLTQVYMGVDPSDGSEDSDEQSYTVMGFGPGNHHIYAAENWGGQEAPAPFARRCIRKAIEWNATLVVEKNHGGGWLKEVFAQAQKDMGTSVRVVLIHASQAKRTRAEPVSLMYDRMSERDGQPLVQHCHVTKVKPCSCEDHAHPDGHMEPDDHMPELEDQMATFTGALGERSPDRLDSMTWAATMFLKKVFGPPVPAVPRRWKAVEELELAGAPSTAGRRRRLAGLHGGLLDSDRDASLEDFEPKGDWDISDFAPQEDNVPENGGVRGNVKEWR
jgi:phage terminase large subunit-like protein